MPDARGLPSFWPVDSQPKQAPYCIFTAHVYLSHNSMRIRPPFAVIV